MRVRVQSCLQINSGGVALWVVGLVMIWFSVCGLG